VVIDVELPLRTVRTQSLSGNGPATDVLE
jgi:hypothetical protein